MSLHKKLKEYSKSGVYPFHMPGHKRNLNIEMPNPYEIDITEIHDMDDLHDPSGVILEEMKRGAALYGSDKCYLLVNGSTVGNLCAIYACCKPKDTILIERSCHKSVYNAVQIAGCSVKYLYSDIEDNIYRGVSVQTVEEALDKDINIKAIVITSPTYEGYVSPIEDIAKLAHGRGIILIVDAAHGAHLGFDEYFPKSPVELGADITIMSMHKTLPALTQTALMHVNGSRVDFQRLEEAIDIFETSSPSYVLMSSISKAFDLVEKENSFSSYVYELKEFYKMAKQLKTLEIIQPDVDKRDASKIIISTAKANISGPQLADICREKYAIEFEMSSFDYVLAMTSMSDTKEGYRRLIEALLAIDKDISTKDKSEATFAGDINIKPAKKYELSQVREMEYENCSIAGAMGRVSFSEICIYPPGSPIVVPGEIIDEKAIELINAATGAGLHVTGLKDKGICVVKE